MYPNIDKIAAMPNSYGFKRTENITSNSNINIILYIVVNTPVGLIKVSLRILLIAIPKIRGLCSWPSKGVML